MDSVSIVIINWNAGGLLSECIQSILKYGKEYVAEIIVVDNFSSDDSIINIAGDQKIKLITNSENLGFAKACNIGFRNAKSKYVLLLNPDTQIKEETLQRCIRFMSENQNIDILGCRHVDNEGRTQVSCARFPSFKTFLNDIVGLSKLFPKYFPPATLMTDWDHSTSREVDQVMGAFMFMNLCIFEKYGYFDERYFVYYEELDFCLRTKKAGGKIFYNADIIIFHKGHGTTANFKAFTLFLSLQSRLKYIRKHFNLFEFLLLSCGIFSIEFILRAATSFVKGGRKAAGDTFDGYKMLIQKGI